MTEQNAEPKATNEAAERLHKFARMSKRTPEARKLLREYLDAALAAERRATVERIRERLVIHHEAGCSNVLFPSEVNAILDEELRTADAKAAR